MEGDLTDIVRAGAGAAAISDRRFPSEAMLEAVPNITPLDGFGDPFSNLRDPLLHLGSPPTIGTPLTTGRFLGVGGHILAPNPSFSGQISGSPVVAPPRGTKNSHIIINANSSPQISSPRKPRKREAKKVVCIPAPAPAPACASNRPTTGEIVPSDLWAWRKYGQKPIKGSPYPRGYYRCSSSKGCPARKQVERSRTDPNMLVITYTSEHNHPWPTQRNALAGSTRSHSSKNASASNTSPKMATAKEEPKEDVTSVKEEVQEQLENRVSTHHDMSEQDSFFVDLDELDTDPLHLLFTQGFGGDNINDSGDERRDQSKGLEEQFSLFDWSEDNHRGL